MRSHLNAGVGTRRVASGVRHLTILLAVAAAAALSVEGWAQTRQLRLASTPWPPFTNTPGQARFAIDLVHTALDRVGVKAETAIVDEGTLTAALFAGKYDGSAALWRDEERERRLIYSQAYLQNRLVLVGRTGSDVSAATLAGLPGKRVALVEGYSYGEVIKNAKGPKYVSVRTMEESVQKVLSGDADYILIDQLVIEYLLTNHADAVKTRLAFGTVPLLVRSLHFALRRDLPDAKAIVDRFDAELPRMVADRSYHRLLQLAWIDADVDGDGRTESVPATDRAGISPPSHRYELLTATKPVKMPSSRRFYVGGEIYEGWSNVPDRYKVGDPTRTPWGATVAPIFSFKW